MARPLLPAAYALTVSGATTVGGGASGFLYITSATGAKTFGDVTVNSGATWNNSGNAGVGISGNLTNSGTFTAGSGTYTNTGSSKNITGTISIPSLMVTGTYANNGALTVATLLTVTSPGVLTNNGTITATTALSGTGGLTQNANSTLNLGGTSGITTLTATASGNMVNFSGAAQTVHVNNYHDLTLSGSGAKTMTSVTNVDGNLTLSGSATATPIALTNIAGNLSLSGTATATNAANLTIGGNLSIGDGTIFTAGAYALTVTGSTTVGGGTSGFLYISSATGAKLFTGLVTISAGGTWNNSGSSAVEFRGGIEQQRHVHGGKRGLYLRHQHRRR